MKQLVNFIIRPPRADYCPKNDLLEEKFILKGRWFHRKDLKVKNGRGLLLHCSHYVPRHFPDRNPLPCVIYCHGNSGCRTDASEAAIILLPSNITVFTLDFSGSGLSEGEHVTLGWNEKEDLRAAVNYLRTEGNVSCIGLWGRSMGAVTSLLYGVEDPSIAGMVLDSPFSNLVDLMMELVDTYKYPLPKFTVKLAIQHMHRVIKKKANFDITDLDTIKAAKSSFVPALFGHATDDDFIQPHHSDQIYKSYTGDKNIIKFDGDHNSPRPQFYFDSITIFFHNVLNPPEVVYDEPFLPDMHGYFDVDNYQTINMLDCDHNSITTPSSEVTKPITRSKEDAINQVRQRRPMSRTDVPSDVFSQEKQLGLEDDQSNTYTQASSSGVINHERSSGSPEYLQYSIDDQSDMPSSIEDEERMLTEAIIMSLNNSVITQASEKNESSSANVCETSSHTFSELALDTSSKSSASLPSSKNALNVTHKDNLSKGDAQTSLDTVSSTREETEANTGDAGTSARLVVQKKSSGHILDGLAQKWGNFFRNNG